MLEPLLRLSLVEGIGGIRLSALVSAFGSAERVLGASQRALAAVPGVGREIAERVLASATSPEVARRTAAALSALSGCGAVALTPDDPAFPSTFEGLADPPYLLFARGNLALLNPAGIAVVGTRLPTAYGRRTAAALAAELATAGYAVVSGMARGIDTEAHTGALRAGGATVGVLGQAIDQAYPAENAALFAEVAAHGLLLSEHPPGVPPLAGNFPRRNRLIAALSEGVLVVEMGLKSGAQHTVTYALEQGKEVFAVPGPIGSPASEGTNQLLREGARLVTSAADIFEELRGVGRAPSGPARAPTPPALGTAGGALSGARSPLPPEFSTEQRRVLGTLGDDARHVDDLIAESGLPTNVMLSVLLDLELRELAESLPGKHFRLR